MNGIRIKESDATIAEVQCGTCFGRMILTQGLLENALRWRSSEFRDDGESVSVSSFLRCANGSCLRKIPIRFSVSIDAEEEER